MADMILKETQMLNILQRDDMTDDKKTKVVQCKFGTVFRIETTKRQSNTKRSHGW